MPKVESIGDLTFLLEKAKYHRQTPEHGPLSLVLSIESAQSLLRMSSIIEQFDEERKKVGLSPKHVHIGALLFASEDYCAATGIVRTRSRKELLFPRAHMATIAKAYNLQAIDMVCIDYKDMDYLKEEAMEARHLGFDGKQAIHPNQVSTIQSTFSPSDSDIDRAAKIKFTYDQAVQKNDAGAVGFTEGNSLIMVDAPLLKQAEAVLAKAQAAGKAIPDVSSMDHE